MRELQIQIMTVPSVPLQWTWTVAEKNSEATMIFVVDHRLGLPSSPRVSPLGLLLPGADRPFLPQAPRAAALRLWTSHVLRTVMDRGLWICRLWIL